MTFQPRPALDLALPMQASATIRTRGKVFESGKPFPWRDLQISESDIIAMWQAGQIDVAPAAAKPPQAQPARPAKR